MVALDSSPLVESWTKRHRIRIRYREGRRKRSYIPDFLVRYTDGRTEIHEVKGYVFDRFNLARKNFAAKRYCELRGWKFRLVFLKDLDEVT